MTRFKFRTRWGVLALGVITILVITHAIASGVLLKKVNAFLAGFSENYYAHIEDFDISLLRGAYRFERIQVALQKDREHPFLTAAAVDVSIAWREILRGRILTDVVIKEALLEGSAQIAQPAAQNKQQSTAEAKEAGTKLFPVEVERIEIQNSKVNHREFNLYIDQINGRLSHFTATEKNPLSVLALKGMLIGETPIKIAGNLNLIQDPVAWVLAAELQGFKTVNANKHINQYFPLTFKKGILDLYTEIKSENGRITGYVKPFLKDAEVVGDDKDFKSVKHFGVEITVALVNLLFRSNQDHVVATKVLFSYEKGSFEWNMSEMLSQLFKNGYGQEIAPGIENLLTLTQEKKP